MSEVKVLATIAGEAFTEADLNRYIEKLPQQQQAYASNPYFREQLVQQVVNTKLMAKYAEEQKLDETEEFAAALRDIRGDVLAQMAIQNLVNSVTVDEDEVKEYFEVNKEQYAKPETVGAKHILVDTEELCNEVLAKINAGEVAFEDAAKEYSTCPSKEQGGDLGQFGHGQMVAEFDQAAFAAEVDQVVGPVKTQFGYHLIKVYNKTEATVPTFEEVAASVKDAMMNERQTDAIQTVLSQLREKYL